MVFVYIFTITKGYFFFFFCLYIYDNKRVFFKHSTRCKGIFCLKFKGIFEIKY